MASWKKEGREDFGSLFEGMVLIDPFSSHDHSPPQAETEAASVVPQNQGDEEPAAAAEDEAEKGRGGPDDSLLHPTTLPSLHQQLRLLDESLFSDLTLVQTQTLPDDNHSCPQATTRVPTSSSASSSTSRKKKRGGFRIGYGRDAPEPDTKSPRNLLPSPYINDNAAAASENHGSVARPLPVSDLYNSNPHVFSESPPDMENKSAAKGSAQGVPLDGDTAMKDQVTTFLELRIKQQRQQKQEEEQEEGEEEEEESQIKSSQHYQQEDNEDQIKRSRQQHQEEEEEEEEEEIKDGIKTSQQQQQQQQQQDPSCDSIGDKLDRFRTHISEKLERIVQAASSVSTARKESVRRRRKVAEDVNSASLNYKDLEKELEEACESEDFDRAEKVSEKLATAERDKEAFVKALREAEAECDSIEFKMQKILELQISTEEEKASMLQAFAKDAADGADLILRNAEEFSSKEMEEWLSSTEALEIKKMELDIESHLLNEVHSGLKDSIEKLIEDDRKEKELLIEKRDVLSVELNKLLVMVRLKEAEITENDYKIEEVEKKIANIMSEFHNAQSIIDMKHDNLQSVSSQIKSGSDALSIKKKEVEDFMSEVERKRSSLKELARICANEAKECQEFAGLRKCLASSVLKSREDKANLAKTEEIILEDVKMLRQQVSDARASLQELSSNRVRAQQEIASLKQRMGFMDKRVPELEAEKKVAAAARNFKEAGRMATEAKALGMEKEELQDKMEKAKFELDEVEKEIKDTVNKLHECERLISSREKEAAIAGCKRLQLVATAAMAERTAALELGDLEEADILLTEAEAANLEAKKLQQAYEFELEEIGNKASEFVSLSLVANLAGQKLAEMAASMQANLVSGQ